MARATLGVIVGNRDFFPDALVTEANAQDRNPVGKPVNHVERDTCFVGIARTRRDDDPVGLELGNFIRRNLVVSLHADVGAQLAEILDEVVGKRIVVIDHQKHGAEKFTP